MDWEASMEYSFTVAPASKQDFQRTVKAACLEFENNTLCKKINAKTIRIAEYQALLKEIFFQVYYSSSTFSLAASLLPPDRNMAREYLIRHSEEERTHWTWILNDLQKTNYAGTLPNLELPSAKALAYVSLNYFAATVYPITRMGIAMVLEGIGSSFGHKYGSLLIDALKLNKDQVSFLIGHGESDTKHTAELWEVLDQCHLHPQEWSWMCKMAETAAQLYTRIYCLE
jgi:hypothetical protein